MVEKCFDHFPRWCVGLVCLVNSMHTQHDNWLVTLVFAFQWVLLIASGHSADRDDWPQVHDDRLELTLFAEHPEIVTPIGLVVGEEGRVFVIESHTHVPPSNYQGPKSDRVKVFIDRDNDGKCDDVSLFADGLNAAMNLAFVAETVRRAHFSSRVFRFPSSGSTYGTT